MGFFYIQDWKKRQKNRCSSCLHLTTAHSLNALRGSVCTEALCLPSDSTNYELRYKSPKKTDAGPPSAPVMFISPYPSIHVTLASGPGCRHKHAECLRTQPPCASTGGLATVSVPPTCEYVSDGNTVNGFP